MASSSEGVEKPFDGVAAATRVSELLKVVMKNKNKDSPGAAAA
jgi:hypothetical protein